MKPSPAYKAWLDATLDPPTTITPDGWRYMAMARGEGAPKPYHYRWLLPTALGTDERKWTWTSRVSVLAMLPAMRWMTGRWAPGLFVFGLDGVWGMARKYPTVVDPFAMLAAIAAGAATRRRRWVAAIVLSLVAGAAKETAPVFAALYAGNPLPLVGMVSPAVMATRPEGPDVTDDFSHSAVIAPFESAWWVRQGKAFDWRLWIAPFGALVAGVNGDPRTLATVAAAYGQTVAAVDTTRLVQWAWPVLADNTVNTFGDRWPVALVAHWFNPWKEAA